jgi:Holliday junction resolvase RusA-like endonuclease
MIVIKGTTPSKSNQYKLIKIAGHCSMTKTDKVKSFEEAFMWQLPGKWRHKQIGLFELTIDVYYPSKRSDLDNSLKVVLDCLQRAGTIKNDNNCMKIVAQKMIDKENPRIEFEITEL